MTTQHPAGERTVSERLAFVRASAARQGVERSGWLLLDEIESVLPAIELLEEENRRLMEQKDGAYSERNQTVVALAHMARLAGYRVGVREHDLSDTEWGDDWRAILMIELPTGQASWHFHDSERPMLAPFPPYPDEWDGHTTAEKYARLRALSGEGEDAR